MTDQLAPATIHSFNYNGHTHIQSFFSPRDLKALISAVDSVVESIKFSKSEMESAVLSYGKSWIFVENILRFNRYLSDFLLAGPLQSLAQRLLGSSQVYLLRDQTYYKFQGGQETPWHQDCLFIPEDGLESVTFWIPFQYITPEHSPMSYIDRSHNSCYLGSDFDRYHSFDTFKALAETEGHTVTTYDDMCPGDLLAHRGWTLHGSPAMPDCSQRKAIVVVYTSKPPNLTESFMIRSCHRDLRSQAFQIRSANFSAYQLLASYLYT